MSPARVLETVGQNTELQTLVSALDALLVTTYQLSLREQDLRRKVQLAHDEYQKLADRVDGGFQKGEEQVLAQICPGDSQSWLKLDPSLKPLEVVDHLRDVGHIQHQLLDVVVAGVSRCRPGVATPNGTGSEIRSNPCIVAEKARRPSLIERDFTTTGVRGSLRCPFAKLVGNDQSVNGTQDGQSSTNKCEFDPIKADLAPELASSAGVSARSSAAARCPIRYMDDHSPEELAQYFENHKHEIPRSHAICVTRFQRNGATMRQMDAKYGSLVNMIQGLGAKHKALLPHPEHNGSSSTPEERVEKWAEDVSSKSPHPATLSTVEEDGAEESPTDRTSRFERPLREIRVGESPSRPWGIPVPVSHEPLSAMNSPVAPVQVSVLKDTPNLAADSEMPSSLQPQDSSPTPGRPRGKCPFDHKALMQSSPDTQPTPPVLNSSAPRAASSSANKDPLPQKQEKTSEGLNMPAAKPAQMVFNGPVFFGYSAEDAAALMQQLSAEAE
ncbi:hypothetical protein BGW36DRAFT_303854 [Talaromyces proteolyticus]|uniref:Uncharacterized protein n=1 Tax=Talaromyces proteolyticus TaxID=1131652 RepID=A0AAD4KJI8_9EURO|nr:uncharacterized protein BGW36DRAFT_303854 [Talaromyces proteolyticus]KAH8692424.1 hypothetical protein BGW36DRAFT_303854 [Talaromyces proteolyticus]